MTSILTPAALRVAAAALARAGAGSALAAIVLLVLASTTRAGLPAGMTPAGATGTSTSVAVAAAERVEPTVVARGTAAAPSVERDIARLAGRSNWTPRVLLRRGGRPLARAP